MRYPLLLTIMTILFGLSFVASKIALTGIGVFQLVFFRYTLAFILLTAIFWFRRHRFVILKKDRKHFLLLTLVEPIGYFIFETFGIYYTTPSNVSLIIATIPVFSLIFDIWLLKESITFPAVAGILLSLIGVYFIVSLQKENALAPQPLLGNLLTLGAAASAGLYNVLCRRLTRMYSPATITYYQAAVATIVFMPFAAGEYVLQGQLYFDSKIIVSIIYLGAGSSTAAYLILNYSLSKLPTYRVAIFANFIPVVTIFVSWLIFGEVLKILQIVGAVLILAGIFLTYLRFKYF